MKAESILYEDNHLIVINKECGEIVQGDKTGDTPLSELVKDFIKERDNKPGNVFLGVIHRLDRPTSGVILFAKTSKALSRMNEALRNRTINKFYLTIVEGTPPKKEGLLTHFLRRDTKKNKSFPVKSEKAIKDKSNIKEAKLQYEVVATTDKYSLLKIHLLTGRHHQIRAQMAAIGCPVKGDLKYGGGNPSTRRPGGIDLHSYITTFPHPTKKEPITVTAPVSQTDKIWDQLLYMAKL